MTIINIDGDDTTWRGLAELTLTPLGSTVPLDLPKPSAFTFALNPQVIRIGTTSTAGYEFQGTEQVVGYDPQFTVVYRQMQPELWALKSGNSYEAGTSEVHRFSRTVRATANTISGAANSSVIGYTIAEDAVTKATITRDHAQVDLTQVDYAAFDADIDDTFAVGSQGELKFANNLVIGEYRVTYALDYTLVGGYKNTTQDIGRFKVDATLITTANEVVLFKLYDVRPMVSGAQFASRQEGIEIGFNILPPLGTSTNFYLLEYTGEFVS